MNKPMTPSDAARIQSSQSKSGQDTGKGSFASRAQSAADRASSKTGNAGSKAGGAGKTGTSR